MSTCKTTLLAAMAALTAASAASATNNALVLNEYNAVGETKYLQADQANEPWKGFDYGNTDYWGTGTIPGYSQPAPYAGRARGNGDNWIELVVIEDCLDIRGWKVEWDNGDPDSGVVEFANVGAWSKLRAGTIITIIENDASFPGVFKVFYEDGSVGPDIDVSSDMSFDPKSGDYHVNANIDDTGLFVTQPGDLNPGNAFKVDNDDWRARIVDNNGVVVMDWVGEDVGGWGGGGVNSEEAGVLAGDLTPTWLIDPVNTANLFFDDNDYSTFGAPNLWSSATITQDHSALQQWVAHVLPGDANYDGTVDSADFNILASNFNGLGKKWSEGNFTTGDGTVDSADFNALAGSFNQTQPCGQNPVPAPTAPAIPEPATLGLLGLGLLGLARRR